MGLSPELKESLTLQPLYKAGASERPLSYGQRAILWAVDAAYVVSSLLGIAATARKASAQALIPTSTTTTTNQGENDGRKFTGTDENGVTTTYIPGLSDGNKLIPVPEAIVAGIKTSTSAELAADASASTLPVPERGLKDSYQLFWDENDPSKGELFRVINPTSGNKGFVLAGSSTPLQVTTRDNNLLPIINPVTNVINTRPSTLQVEMVRVLTDNPKIRRVIFKSDREKAGDDGFSFGQTISPEDGERFINQSWVVRPDEYPDALVLYYSFNETDRKLDPKREEQFNDSLLGHLGVNIKLAQVVPPNTNVTKMPADSPEIAAFAGDFVFSLKPVKLSQESSNI